MAKSLGQIAYEGYFGFIFWESPRKDLPTWAELSKAEKEAWENAADDVATRVKWDLSDE